MTNKIEEEVLAEMMWEKYPTSENDVNTAISLTQQKMNEEVKKVIDENKIRNPVTDSDEIFKLKKEFNESLEELKQRLGIK